MSDLKLFRISDSRAVELQGSAVGLERTLQRLIEQNMETLFGVRFVASEYSTGPRHRGRIDSLGIDENGSPVIFEYKRSRDENVVTQGLFYLDWLQDHRAEFELLIMRSTRLAGAQVEVDWDNPRLVCVAGEFTRYDEHAVGQINRTIELVRYRDFGGELLALELLTAVTQSGPGAAGPGPAEPGSVPASRAGQKTVSQLLAQSPQPLRDLHAALDTCLTGFGEDVQMTVRKNYFAYKRLKNFACVEVHPQSRVLLVYLKVDPASIDLSEGFTRDVSDIGHFGTGDLEVRIHDHDDLAAAEPLLTRSYETS